MSEQTISLKIGNEEFSAEIGVIEQVLDGPEAHGIPAWSIAIKFGGGSSIQSTGTRRSGTASGQREIVKVLDTLDASSLSHLIGTPVYALRRGTESRFGMIAGIANGYDISRVTIFAS